MTRLLLGCSGWSYDEWVGPFYEAPERKFSQYARVFKTAEIDSTFYSYPTPSLALGLLRASPSDFVFSAKLPKLITHEKRLSLSEGVEEDLRRFTDVMRILRDGGRLGPILVQLPPSFRFTDVGVLEAFLAALPEGYEFAVEFRHGSWLREEAFKLLSDHGAAYTIVDEPLLPPETRTTASFAYIRWHGHGANPWFNYRYTDQQLDGWVPRLKEVEKKVHKVYGYFNNHYHGYAVENCLKMMEKLGTATPEQKTLREKATKEIDRQRGRLPP